MVRPKIVIIAVGLLVLGIGLRLWLARRAASRPTAVSPRRTEVAKASPQIRHHTPRHGTPQPKVLTREELEALSRGQWGRNPFLTADEEAALLNRAGFQKVAGPEFPTLEVKTILISEGTRMALIDGHIVTEGDLIGAERVVEIRPRAVVLRRGKSIRTVEMEFPAVRVHSAPAPTGPR